MLVCKTFLLLFFFHANVLFALGGFMKKADGYNISKKDFIQLSKCAENAYNIAVVIYYFVSNQLEIEECYNLVPVVKHLKNNADLLNSFFINFEDSEK